MDKMARTLSYGGLLIPLWLLVGVIVAGSFYPGYSHYHQALSELGARGAPTEWLSPAINNYPLGLLFIGFGWAVARRFRDRSRAAVLSGWLIALHGIGSIGAGYFPCDVGCLPEASSLTQQLHFAAGGLMLVSLVVASGLWWRLSQPLLGRRWFGRLSLLCALAPLALLLPMALAVESGEGAGLWQRLGYGFSVLWVGVLALLLLRSEARGFAQSPSSRGGL